MPQIRRSHLYTDNETSMKPQGLDTHHPLTTQVFRTWYAAHCIIRLPPTSSQPLLHLKLKFGHGHGHPMLRQSRKFNSHRAYVMTVSCSSTTISTLQINLQYNMVSTDTLSRSPFVTKTLLAVETSCLSKFCPRLEMPRCSLCAISVVGLTVCCKELKGDSARQLFNRDVVQDIVGWWLSRWAGDTVCVDGWRVESGLVDASGGAVLMGIVHYRFLHEPTPFMFCTHTLAMERKAHAILVPGGADEISSRQKSLLHRDAPFPSPLYGVTEVDDLPSKWNFITSLTPFLSLVKASRGISSYPYERSYAWYGS
ncbi:hypothetical protein M422DRAFT_272764 [Sphaerobolus stellatus SS14]|uniref:Uncharacterized protein n=1 Tax=Sphaerobolus stellatus (strain SS14) TaxID=990650 RepID=A0A0C9TAP7_SPHS4|nr:hypothetical protein M422DRAFT_272764 [Sphaerobolus stellatus SS14]